MAHWEAKFSNGTYLVLKKDRFNDPFYDDQPKWIQIIDGSAFNYYKIKKYTANFKEVIKDEYDISDTELHAFSFIENIYEPSLSKTLKIL